MRLGSAGGSAPPTAAAGRARAGGARESRGRPVRTASAHRGQGSGAVPAAWRPRGQPRPSAAPTCSCRPCPPPAGRSLPAPPRTPRLPARPGPPDASLAPPQPCGPGGGASGPGPPPSPVRHPIGRPLLSVSWERLRPHWVAPEGEEDRALGLWEPAADPSVFVCTPSSYGLHQFQVQVAKVLELLLHWSALGTSFRPLPPSRTHSRPGTLWLAMEGLFGSRCWPCGRLHTAL